MALTSLKSSIHEVPIKFHACKSEKLIRRYFKTLCFIQKSHKKMFARCAREAQQNLVNNLLLRVRPTRTRARCARGTQDFLRDHPSGKNTVVPKEVGPNRFFFFGIFFFSHTTHVKGS